VTYFLAGRDATWIAIGASIFASNIGSEHLIGLAGAGASSGMAMAHWEIQGWMILILGWVFVPFYSRSMVLTDARNFSNADIIRNHVPFYQ